MAIRAPSELMILCGGMRFLLVHADIDIQIYIDGHIQIYLDNLNIDYISYVCTLPSLFLFQVFHCQMSDCNAECTLSTVHDSMIASTLCSTLLGCDLPVHNSSAISEIYAGLLFQNCTMLQSMSYNFSTISEVCVDVHLPNCTSTSSGRPAIIQSLKCFHENLSPALDIAIYR